MSSSYNQLGNDPYMYNSPPSGYDTQYDPSAQQGGGFGGFVVKGMMTNTLLNYAFNNNIYFNSGKGGAIRSGGISGLRWLGKGGSSDFAPGGFIPGGGILNKAASNIAGGAIGLFNKEAGSKFAKYGLQGFDNTLAQGLGVFFGGSNSRTIIGTAEGLDDGMSSLISVSNKSYLGKRLAGKGLSRLAKAGGVIGIGSMVAEMGYDLTKWGLKKTDELSKKLSLKLRDMRSDDIVMLPQLVNQYSQTMRQRALSEIHSSQFSPRNMMLGNEASNMHRGY